MAIRFDYQVGAGLIGAYAAGQSAARQRKQKYAMDMWQQERQLQARQQEQMAGFKYRTAMGTGGQGLGAGGQGFGQQAGTWADPFAKAGTPEERVQINAQRQANARAERMGQPTPYPKAEPQPIPAQTRDEIQHKWALEAKEQARGEAVGDAEAAAQRAQDAEIENDIQAGKLELTPRAQAEIKKIDDGLIEAMTGGQLDEAGKSEAVQKANEKKGEIKRWGTQLAEDPNKGMLVADEDTGLLRPPAEGERATHRKGAPGQPPEMLPEEVERRTTEKEEKKAAAAAQADEQKRLDAAWEAEQTRFDELNKLYITELGKELTANTAAILKRLTDQIDDQSERKEKARTAAEAARGGQAGGPSGGTGGARPPATPGQAPGDTVVVDPATEDFKVPQRPDEAFSTLDENNQPIAPQAPESQQPEPFPLPPEPGPQQPGQSPAPLMADDPSNWPAPALAVQKIDSIPMSQWPSTGKATAQEMADKGWAYGTVLDSKGQPTKKRAWERAPQDRPKPTQRPTGGNAAPQQPGKDPLPAGMPPGTIRIDTYPPIYKLPPNATQAHVEALPSGTLFIGPDGKKRRKN